MPSSFELLIPRIMVFWTSRANSRSVLRWTLSILEPRYVCYFCFTKTRGSSLYQNHRGWHPVIRSFRSESASYNIQFAGWCPNAEELVALSIHIVCIKQWVHPTNSMGSLCGRVSTILLACVREHIHHAPQIRDFGPCCVPRRGIGSWKHILKRRRRCKQLSHFRLP